MTARPSHEPLHALRQYQRLAPWNLKDLVALASAILDASGVRPTSAVASQYPSERTVRFYVTKGLVAPPMGRGAAATYAYKHLLHLLFVKLRQMEGATLDTIADEMPEHLGDAIERQVARTLGDDLPAPSELTLDDPASARGRSARAVHRWHALDQPADDVEREADHMALTKWHRVPAGAWIRTACPRGTPALRSPLAH